MKQMSWIVLRPVCFFVFLIVVVLSLAALLITLWFNNVARIEKEVKSMDPDINREFIHNAAALFSPNNASAINLARILNFSLDGNDLHHFPKIETKVVPVLFQACSLLPHLAQISYVGLNGLFFAYYKEADGDPYALYSNSTFPSRNDTEKKYTWYLQPASRETGERYDEAVKFPPPAIDWLLGALNTSNGYASVGTGWKNPQDDLLLSSVGLDGKGVVSLGFSLKPLIDFLAAEIDGSCLYLVREDWNMVVRGLPNTRTILNGDGVSFQLLSNVGQLQTVRNITCQSHVGDSRNDVVMSIAGKKYVITCSPAAVAGLQFMYVSARPRDEYWSLVHKNITLSFVLLGLMVGATVATVFVFMLLIMEAARREMYLCGALIKQMESTQQSERKSMNKSLAFASASHDIRASLAGITGLIELCRNEVSKREPTTSQVVENLLQMEACTRDLLGILNCILDTSKIEAGKMQLEKEDFNVEQLVEDVVDLYHPAGMKKGIDVILDPSDGSISTYCRARGDRSKLKQILSNLLSNAVKFTNEGHVTVRAWARKPSLNDQVLGSHRSNLLCFFFKIQRGNNTEPKGVERDPNCMEFVFEVSDTGKGIPKEKRKFVFENYVQVKETALGQQGTGLGLGIVQSLVRLMGGEIGIVEKEVGERGTCFRFNVMLTTNGDSFDHLGRLESPTSQVILMIQSAKRSNVVQAFMQKLGIKVHVVKHQQQLARALKQIRRKLLNQSSSCNSTSDGYASSARSVPLSTLDGVDDRKRPWALLLVVIDTRAGSFREISKTIADLRSDLNHNCYCRVVWLDSRSDSIDEDKLPPPDLVISKPFHGSRLYETIVLLPEFGGVPPRRGETSAALGKNKIESYAYGDGDGSGEIQEQGKPLTGKRILVVDDDPLGRKIATFVVSQLGAIYSTCENGAEAWQRVCGSLEGEPSRFDCILMDCEMPVMNGSEATVRIRESENGYGVRTPIIALTAHSKGQEIDNMMQAGVDGYIAKPLNKDNFLKLISQFIS